MVSRFGRPGAAVRKPCSGVALVAFRALRAGLTGVTFESLSALQTLRSLSSRVAFVTFLAFLASVAFLSLNTLFALVTLVTFVALFAFRAIGGIEGVRNGLEFGQAQIDVVGAAARVNLDVHPNSPAPIDAVHCGGVLRAHKHAQHAIAVGGRAQRLLIHHWHAALVGQGQAQPDICVFN